MELLQLPILVEHPRCPFCHDALGPADDATPCLTCRAWQHADCASEGAGRCGACRAVAHRAPVRVKVSPREASRAAREQAWSLALWVVAGTLLLTANEVILPAFCRMYREVGMCLPVLTEWVLGEGRWVLGGALLTLLHAGALARDPVWRARLQAGAVAFMVASAALTVTALFLPLVVLDRRL